MRQQELQQLPILNKPIAHLVALAGHDFYRPIATAQNHAFFIHGRKHSVPHESRELIYGRMDNYLKPPEAIASKLVKEKKRTNPN